MTDSTTSSCTVCGRPLKDPESIARGMGPVCAGKRGSGKQGNASSGSHRRELVTMPDTEITLDCGQTDAAPLSPTERESLRRYEETIEHGLKTFVAVGNALIYIRNGRLYREEYTTFEAYCDEKWGFTGRKARYLMGAAKTVAGLAESGTIVPLPENEAQARPLIGLPPEQQVEAWQRAAETAPAGGVTAAHVQSVVDEMTAEEDGVSISVNDMGDVNLKKYIDGQWIEVGKARTGFPKVCPIERADPVCGANCKDCRFLVHTRKGTNLCRHLGYQEAPGAHFCHTCGRELSPYIQARGGEFCGPDGEYCKEDLDSSRSENVNTIADDAQWETLNFDSVEHETPTPPSLAGRGPNVHFSTGNDEYLTPLEIVDAALSLMGEIDLDPCSNSHEAPNVPAVRHYTVEDDGLDQEWHGRVYMNPPYGRAIEEWVEKLCAEHEAGRVTEAVALVPARTDTQWWVRLRDYPVCLVEGRLRFVGSGESGAPFPSAIFYLGPDLKRFYDAFYHLGDIWQRVDPGLWE